MPIVYTEIGYGDDGYGDDPYAVPIVFANMGLQFSAFEATATGLQFKAVIYNTNLLRIMCEFLSRGQVGTGGNNAWGFAKGLGLNWISNSTEPGDFDVNNLNTDIVEQGWRSATGTKTGIILRCDTEIEQGVFADTFTIQNHNLTSSAVVNLEASTDPSFGTVGLTVPLQITDDNVYWMPPDLPNTGYRYWRLTVSDASNPDNFIFFGTCAFGVSEIFIDEQNTDSIDYGFKDYADKVETEGFTNASISRSQKKQLHLDFRLIDRQSNNFSILRTLTTRYRTTHKCLWIPTPDDVDMEVTAEFAVFAKLVGIQKERHNYKGPRNQYVDMSFDLDEAA